MAREPEKTNGLPDWANEPEEWGFIAESENSDSINEIMQGENWPNDDHEL